MNIAIIGFVYREDLKKTILLTDFMKEIWKIIIHFLFFSIFRKKNYFENFIQHILTILTLFPNPSWIQPLFSMKPTLCSRQTD